MECVNSVKTYHGIDVYEESWERLTKDQAFEGYMPEEVCISLCQMHNKICCPTVKEGEYVSKGQVIGETQDEKYACVHASISGYVTEIFEYQRGPGVFEPFIRIKKESNGNREWHPFSLEYDKESISKMMYQIGIHKEERIPGKILIVNGFANEPYITSGYRLILESSGKIVLGSILWAIAAEAEKIYLCVNEDALDAVVKLRRAVQKYGHNLGNRRPIWVVPMKRKYPKGNEHMIRSVIAGKEKAVAKVVSIAEMTALYDGIYDGEPWTKVGITLSGKIKCPKNLWVPVGTSVKEIIEYCGGMPQNALVICGGPLGGTRIDPSNFWIRRDSYGILVLNLKDIPEYPCVQCGTCREVCPQKLKPDLIEKGYLEGKSDIHKLHVKECLHCGLCSYVCPSGRRLTEYVGQVKKGHVRKKGEEKDLKGSYILLNTKAKGIKKLDALEVKSHSAPHIHRRGTIRDVMRNSIYGLIPLIVGVLMKNPSNAWHVFSMICLGVIGAVLSEYYWQSFKDQFSTVGDGSAVFSGILLALLFSEDTALWKVAAAAVISVWIGKQCFGGIGKAPIHPAIMGKLIFQPFGVPMIEPLWYLAVLSLIWMVVTRMIPWKFPITYLIITGVGSKLLLTSAFIYVTAAYLIWSYETMAPTRIGKWLFTLILSVLTVLFYHIGMGICGICFAVAFTDLFRPFMNFGMMKSI